MIATVINAVSVILGSLIGLVLRNYVTTKKQDVVMTGAGVVTVLIGIYMGLKTSAFVELVLALIIGGLIGSALRIEDTIEGLGKKIEMLANKRTSVETIKHETAHSNNQSNTMHASNFAKGFLDASVLFCAGAMTILGAIEAGVNKNYTLLLTKSVLDGFMAIVFASIYGAGVAFSAVSVLVYQGLLTALGILLKPLLSDTLLSGISGAGGCLVIMIGLNLLKLTKLKTADFLPSLIIAPLMLMLATLFA